MGNSQERKDEGQPAGRMPADAVPGGRSGEGAASALEQLITQDRQRQRQQQGLGSMRDPHEG